MKSTVAAEGSAEGTGGSQSSTQAGIEPATEAEKGAENAGTKVPLHQEIIHLIAWSALLATDIQCCRGTFEDLINRLVQLGPFFASLDHLKWDKGSSKTGGESTEDILKKEDVKKDLQEVAASLLRVSEIIDLCREPSLQLHLLLQNEELLKRLTMAGGEVGLKVEKLIHDLLKYEVDMEETVLKNAVNGAYNLQNVVYNMDECDRNSLDSVRLLIRRYQPSNAPNASTSQVSFINGEPLELFADMLARRAQSGTYTHRCNKTNTAFNSMCERVNNGEKCENIDVSEAETAPPATRKPRISLSGVWTRPPPLSIDATISSPRVLWEVDTPTSSQDWSTENFRLMDEGQRICAVEAEMESDTGKCTKKACEPPPPHVQEVTPEDMLPVTYVGVQKRISFIPGQEGGQRRKSYIEGVQSPVRKCRRHSRRSYLVAGEDAPWEYLCPITRELMVDPVTLSTGQTYDRVPISKWINDGHHTCPVTELGLPQPEHLFLARLPISNTDLLPNYALRHAIGRWAAGHNIKLPEPEECPIQEVMIINMSPLQKLQEWGQRLPDKTAPVMGAVAKLYRGSSQEQEVALQQLCDLAKDGGEEGRCMVAEVGAIPGLVYQVQNGTPLARELAARCLRFLCRSTNVLITQATSSAIPFLVNLLHQGTPDACEAAAGALVNLSAKNEVNKLSIAAAGAIPWLTQMLDGKAMFSSFTTQEIAAAALCNLSVNDSNRVEIAKEGAISLLIQVVKDCPTPEAGEYAAHALGSLACDNFNNASLMIEADAAEVLVAMAGPGTPWTQEAAARAIRNISFHEPLRPALCKAGAVQQLNALLEYSTPRAADAAATALWNFTPKDTSGVIFDIDVAEDVQETEQQPETKKAEQFEETTKADGVEKLKVAEKSDF